MKQWFVAYTKPREERRALDNLCRQDFETYLPLCREIKVATKPLFPRYLFVRFDLTGDFWGSIRSTRGVVDLLKTNDVPSRVPEEWIAEMRGAERSGAIDLIPSQPYKAGEELEITQGPFLGHSGILQAGSDRDRAILAMRLFGTLKDVEFDYSHLRKAG